MYDSICGTFEKLPYISAAGKRRSSSRRSKIEPQSFYLPDRDATPVTAFSAQLYTMGTHLIRTKQKKRKKQSASRKKNERDTRGETVHTSFLPRVVMGSWRFVVVVWKRSKYSKRDIFSWLGLMLKNTLIFGTVHWSWNIAGLEYGIKRGSKHRSATPNLCEEEVQQETRSVNRLKGRHT